ncbi:MAG: methylated-DNA--[protein]-cysteine S-methyltransferase [Dehalococcoidia bacterium]
MNSTIRFHVAGTDLGWVPVTLSDNGLHSIELPFATREAAMRSVAESGASDPVSSAEAAKIDAMIAALVLGRPVNGTLPIDWAGITPFRRQVLEECGRIPAGQTKSYGWLAAQVGRPNAARAVGRVMATNPWPLLIPCHRVVGSTGALHGYGGGLPLKERLLKIEGAVSA